MPKKIENNNGLTFSYNKNTLLIVNKNQISYLTVIPLIQQRNAEIADADTLKSFQGQIKELVLNLQAYDSGTSMSEGALGPVYKVISLYNKLSPLQKYQVEKNVDEIGFFKNKKSGEVNDYFLQEKEKYTINECLSYNEYNKEDYLIVQTFIPRYQTKKFISDKILLKDYFSDLTDEKYSKIKNNIDQMYLTHKQNLMENFANKSYDKMSPYVIYDILAKLNLNTTVAYFNNLNALDKNIWGDYNKKDENYQIDILQNEADDRPYVLIVKSNSIVIHDTSKAGTEVRKLFQGQKLKAEWNQDKTIYNIFIEDNGAIIPVKKVVNPYKVEESYEKKFKYNFTLAEIPLSFDKNMVEVASNALKRMGFDNFNVITEIMKKPSKILEAQITFSKRIYSLLSALPSLQGFLFNPELVKKKLIAFNSILHHMEDGGKEFSTSRFSFSLTLPYNIDKEVLEFKINQVLSTNSVSVELLQGVAERILDPLPYKPFFKVYEKHMDLENSEIEQLIDLKFGNSYFNMLDDTNIKDLAKIDNAHLYVKAKDKVQSINIFEGPDMFNGLIIAPSGSGKSFLTVNLINGFLSSNSENLCWILDRGGSYVNFTETFGGININLKKTDELNCINPFVFDNYFAKLVYMEEIFNENKKLERLKNKLLKRNVNLENHEIVESERTINELNKSIENNEFETDEIKIIDEEDIIKMKEEIVDFENNIKKYKAEILKNKKEIPNIDSKYMKNIDKIKHMLTLVKFRGRDNILKDENDTPIGTQYEDLMPQDIIEIFVILFETMLQTKKLDDKIRRLTIQSIKFNIKKFILNEVIKTKENDTILYILIEEFQKDLLEDMIKNDVQEQEAKAIVSTLDEYIDPILSGKLFNGKPALDLSSLLVNIDFGEIQDEGLSDLVLSALLLNYFSVMTSDKYRFSKKLLIIDEAHAVLNGEEISGLKSVSYLYRTARKHGGAIWLLSQGIRDFVKTAGEVPPEKMALFGGIIGNAGWKILLGSHSKTDLEGRMDLNNETTLRIFDKPEGSREFYVISKVSGFVSLIVSDLHYAIATTNKEEKNILKAIDLLTANTQNSLLVYANVFGKTFIPRYASIDALKNEFGSKIDMVSFKNKLSELYSNYDEELKNKVIKKIENTSQINIEIINAVLVKAEIESKITKVKDVVLNSQQFHIK